MECQNGLGLTGIDAVPSDGLHITVRSVGDTTTVTSEQVDTLVSPARERLSEVKPFDLTVGPLSGSRSAIRLSVAPWDPVLDLQRILSRVPPSFRRNMRLGTYQTRRLGSGHTWASRINNTDRAAAIVIAAVGALRRPERVSVRVATVELVVLRNERSLGR
ncbi:hypothetical protein ACIA5E_30775 [Nocardia asteroides]|uniref:hypothetical protein n=1 Tax=Nocardia asteroides TaxID=1824 RepID=UPI0037A0CB37